MSLQIDEIAEEMAANIRYNVGKLRASGAWMGIEVPQKNEPGRKAGNDVKTNDGWYDFSDAGTIV